jgi:carbamoyltransferase
VVVLGFSIGHDRGAVLIKDGKIVVGINDERLVRIKRHGAYSPDLPQASIEYCLKAANLSYSDVDLYVHNYTETVEGVSHKFEQLTGQSDKKLKFIPHHLAHAFGTFYASGFNTAAVVVIDAMGSPAIEGNPAKKWYKAVDAKAEAWSIYNFTKNGYSEVYKKWVDHPLPVDNSEQETSIGGLYAIGSLQLVYSPRTNAWQAGKLMGLASYADLKWVEKQPRYSYLGEDGFPIIPASRIHPEVTYRSDFRSKANIAGLYQREQELLSMTVVEKAKELTSNKNVCVAGGSFLNCNTNERIIKSGLFEKAYFLPSADDSGIALGCAWYGAFHLKEKTPTEFMSPYLGKTYSREEIFESLHQANLDVNYRVVEGKRADIAEAVAALLAQDRVVGLFQGGSETGPRALGNRSILANPGQGWIVNYINSEVKGREWYRPFAPSVLAEFIPQIFELDEYSPYMLITTTVKPEWREKLPAITHIDNTARYQSVTEENNPYYYAIINEMYKKTGLPVVLNTSFNGPEEPIVETPLDAILTFKSTGMFALVIENFLILPKL